MFISGSIQKCGLCGSESGIVFQDLKVDWKKQDNKGIRRQMFLGRLSDTYSGTGTRIESHLDSNGSS